MKAHDTTRPLVFHGPPLSFQGMCVSMFVQSTRNPRMAAA